MAASFEDYAWIRKWRNGLLMNAYCLTLIDGLDVEGVLDGLGATDRADGLGIGELSDACYEAWDRFGGERLLVGVTAVGAMTLMFEDNGYIGITRELMLPLASTGSVFGHYRNVNALSWFLWIQGFTTMLEFETLFPTLRSGAMADEVVDELIGAGFHLGATESNVDHPTGAAFALAERLSGLRVTPAVLDDAVFNCGAVRLPTAQR